METESIVGFSINRGYSKNDSICSENLIFVEPIVSDDDNDSNHNNSINDSIRQQQIRQQRIKSILNQQSNSPILMSTLTSPFTQPQSSPSSSSSSSTSPQIFNHHFKISNSSQINMAGVYSNTTMSNNPMKPKFHSILIHSSQGELKNRATASNSEFDFSKSNNEITVENKNKIIQVKNVVKISHQLNPGSSSASNHFVPCSSSPVVSTSDCDDTLIEVVCGDNIAQLNLNRLAKGTKVSCVWFKGTYMTANQFQHASGRATARDWKRSIKHGGSSLKVLMFNKTITLSPAKCGCSICSPTSSRVGNASNADRMFISSCGSSPGGLNNSLDSSMSYDPRLSMSTDDRDSVTSCFPMDLTFRTKPDSDRDSDDDFDPNDDLIDTYLKIMEPQYLEECPLDLSMCDESDIRKWKVKAEFLRLFGLNESPIGEHNKMKMEYLTEMKEKTTKYKQIKEKRAKRKSRKIKHCTDDSLEITTFDAPLDLALPFKKRCKKELNENKSHTNSSKSATLIPADEKFFLQNGFYSNIGASLSSECYTVNSFQRPRVNKEIFSRDLASKLSMKINRRRKINEDKRSDSSSSRFSTIPINSQNLSFFDDNVACPNSPGPNSSFSQKNCSVNRHTVKEYFRNSQGFNFSTMELHSNTLQGDQNVVSPQYPLDIKTAVLKKQLWRTLVANPSSHNSNDLPELVTNHISPSPELEVVIKSIMHKMLTEHSCSSFTKSNNGVTPALETSNEHDARLKITIDRHSPNNSGHDNLNNDDDSDGPTNLIIVSNDEDDEMYESNVNDVYESTILSKPSEGYLPDLVQSNMADQDISMNQKTFPIP